MGALVGMISRKDAFSLGVEFWENGVDVAPVALELKLGADVVPARMAQVLFAPLFST